MMQYIRPIVLLTFTLVFVSLLSCKNAADKKDGSKQELRGVWLTNVDSRVLESRQGIAEAMDFLAGHNFNLVCPVVWNKGHTLYRSAVMDSIFGIPIDPLYGERDPLAELIEEAHKRQIAVIVWFEFGFSPSHQKSSRYILEKKPHWAARDKHGEILNKNGFDWMNAYHPEVQDFILSLIEEVVKNYKVDGIQGDDRLPAQPSEGGYSEHTVQLYQEEHNGNKPPQDHMDESWLKWRANILNQFAGKIYRRVKAIEQNAIVSWAPSIYPWSYEEYLQDWPTWADSGWVDILHTQNYREDYGAYEKLFHAQLEQCREIGLDKSKIYPGVMMNVGDYLMDERYLKKVIKLHRSNDINGEIYFFYEGLRKNKDKLAKLLKNEFYMHKAEPPFKTKFW